MQLTDIDALIAAAVRDARFDCHQGCSWCCHQLVVMTCRDDARRILEAARSRLDPAEFTAFEATVREQAEAIAAMGHEAAEGKRWTCPLLGDGRCLVYDVRPVACRSVFSEDAGCCRAMMEAEDFSELSEAHQRLATQVGERAFALQIEINDRRPIDGAKELRAWLVELLDESLGC